MDVISDLSPLSPGLIDELEAFMAPVGEGCFQVEARRTGGHQLPDSPPDSGSENPYSPSENQITHAIAISQTVLAPEYMIVQDQMAQEILQQNGDFIYEELKSDNIDHEALRSTLSEVVVLPQESNIMQLGLRSVRQDLDEYNRYNQMRLDLPELDQGIINPQMVALTHDQIAPVYTSLQEPSAKKRKHSQEVKCEPAASSPEAGQQGPSRVAAAASIDGSEAGDDASQQCIRFAPFQHVAWHSLYDASLKPIAAVTYIVGADKGFNYSQVDEAFVCQKKNHFQVTCQVQITEEPHYIETPDGLKKINKFCLHFFGVKAEDPSQEVRVEQSQSDRTKKPFHPVPVELRREGTKLTVGRLHFAETTNNNMRKKGRPNPDQRHFQLVVALRAHVQANQFTVAAHASDRIIVRASNPGQFESDCSEGWWQRGVSENSVYCSGRVGINTDRPDEACVVNGNLKVMGHIVHPSDLRAKHNIEELDTAQQLKNVQSIRVVKFNYDPMFARHSGVVEDLSPLSENTDYSSQARRDTGVIAQEVRRVLPDAVREAGDLSLPNGDTIRGFLVVNKDRIFMENLGAVKELCKVTGNLESRIDQLERVNNKLRKLQMLQRKDSDRSSTSNDSRVSVASHSSKSLYSDGNLTIEQIRDIARNIRRHECCHKLSHNSPKYTRKQCKTCHGNYAKHSKQNKKSNRAHANENIETFSYSNEECNDQKTIQDEKINMASIEKSSRLWSSCEESFAVGNTKYGFCCRRRDRFAPDLDLISNKALQIVIAVLIFIMATCLVVMSALYFREHQELMSIREGRTHDKLAAWRLGASTVTRPAPVPRNDIQNLKPSQGPSSKKTAKEKTPHRTTLEYTNRDTSQPTELPRTTLYANRNYVKNGLDVEQIPKSATIERVSLIRRTDVIGGGCVFTVNTDNELDAECQTSCSVEPPQTYDNPLERSNSEKESLEQRIDNNRSNDSYTRPLETTIKNKKNQNDQEISKIDQELKNREINDELVAESNLLDSNKQNGSEIGLRVKRGLNKRETNEALLRSSSEEMTLSERSDEMRPKDCDRVAVAMSSQSVANISLFSEEICPHVIYNFTYTVPLSHCLHRKHVDIIFSSSKLKEMRLCELRCKHDTAKNCQLSREFAKPVPTGNEWTSRMTLDCNIDRSLKIRAAFAPSKELCFLTHDHKIPFVEFNLHIYRDCHN